MFRCCQSFYAMKYSVTKIPEKKTKSPHHIGAGVKSIAGFEVDDVF